MPQHLTLKDGGWRRRYLYTPLVVLALLALCASGLLQPAVQAAATFTVNSTGDAADSNTADGLCDDGSGNCTLRAAIEQANATPGADTITFSIGSGVKTIVMTSDLPVISDPVVINGTTQPGFAGTPIVELNGNGFQTSAGLRITAGNSTVRGLVMNSFNGSLISLTVNGGNRVVGNYIGTDVTGRFAPSILGDGIFVSSDGNVIGGTAPADRNVISGNGEGVTLAGNNNVVQGNYIGTNAEGTAALPNGVAPVGNGTGIQTRGGANNTIGGAEPGAGNVISGNRSDGIRLGSGLKVQGNLIGTNAEGTAALPNGVTGMEISGSGNTIGGTTPAARNVISGNQDAGIKLLDAATANVVQGNYIGVSADGTRAVPNSNQVGNSSGGIFFRYARGNTIGGVAPGAGNVIAHNGRVGGRGGVIVVPFNFDVPNTDSRNSIRGNSIYSNLGPGIDLFPNGVTPNDANDADEGANNLQNFPVLTSLTRGDGSTAVQGTLNSKPSTTYDLDFYASDVCDESGNGEGARFLGTAAVQTDGAGNASFNVTLPASIGAGQSVAATATDPVGNTSEFSACLGAGGAPSGTVQFTLPTLTVNENAGTATFTLSREGGTAGAITVGYSTFGGSATAGSDFEPVSGSITFADGEAGTKSFTVPIINDPFNELTEFFTVSLSAPAGDSRLGTPATTTVTIGDNDPRPVASVSDAHVVEGDEGTVNAVFTVRLVGPTALPVGISYLTFRGTAYAGADYQETTGSLLFAPGETVKTFTVPVLADRLGEPEETFNVRINAGSGRVNIGDGLGLGTIQDNDPNPVSVVIGEFRFRGAAGEQDEFVELFNNSDAPVNVATADGSAGWALVAGDQGVRHIIPNGTVIPARGHYLVANPNGYSLSGYPAARGSTATPDATFTSPVSDSSGVALFRTADSAAFNYANRLDAVGFGLDLNNGPNVPNGNLFTEGSIRHTGVTENGEYSFVRRSRAGGLLQDTDNNSDDFFFVSTTGAAFTTLQSVRGAAGPENLAGPTSRAQLPVTPFDPAAPANAEPNQSRAGSGDSGTLTLRRRVTNNTGSPVTRLRFRVTDLTTAGRINFSPLPAPAPLADLRLLDSADAGATRSDGSSSIVRGVTVEQPPAQPLGGGVNSTAAAGAVSLASPLAPGAGLDVQFVFNVVKDGNYAFGFEAQSDAAPNAPTFQFAAADYGATESNHSATVTVTRTGDTSGAASVSYTTSDGTASELSDYIAATGTLAFAPGEATKDITVLLTDDAYTEAGETILVRLSGASGASLGTPSTATVTIGANDTPQPASNPIDDSAFFVRQHYHDFLNREPDPSGFNFWTNEIESCGADAQCREVKRVNVSAAFFLSIEFQETGFLAYRTYKAAYGDATSPNVPGTVPVIRLREFLADAQGIGRDVQVNVGDWEARLEANKNAYMLEFVRRQRFTEAFPASMTAAEFVDKLNQNAGGVLSPAERQGLIANLEGAGKTAVARASTLRQVAEDADLRNNERNRAFVLMEYFGYLRRNPDDAPEPGLNYGGWKFWLDKLNEFNGDAVAAEMVKAFITSVEYRRRFGQ